MSINGPDHYVLHIGRNKTGTSSLQEFFAENEGLLRESGILYPEAGREGKAHHGLALAVKRANQDRAAFEVLAAKLRQEVADHREVLVSSEVFATLDELDALATLFPAGKTTIVVYVREYCAYLSSWYRQAIQLRNLCCDFRAFVDLRYIDASHIGLLERWANVYGRSNIKVLVYDRTLYPNGNILLSVPEYLPHVPLDSVSSLNYSRNPSISGNLVFLKLLLNSVLPETRDYTLAAEVNKISQHDKKRFQGEMHLDMEIVRRINFTYREDRQQLQSLFGLTLPRRNSGINGLRVPDAETWAEDVQIIKEFCTEKEFELLRYMKMLNL